MNTEKRPDAARSRTRIRQLMLTADRLRLFINNHKHMCVLCPANKHDKTTTEYIMMVFGGKTREVRYPLCGRCYHKVTQDRSRSTNALQALEATRTASS